MSYQSQDQLANDVAFIGRNRAVCIQQAQTTGVGDTTPTTSALSGGIIRDDGPYVATFVRLAAGGPGVADKATLPDGSVDQSRVTDADLLSLTQANYATVAGLYFTEDGSPR